MLDPNLQSLFNVFSQASRASQYAMENADRFPYPLLGIVTKNEDPDNQRRIKCSISAIPALETYWIRRLPLYPGFDPPMPQIGQTVLILCNQGNETEMSYIAAQTPPNPPLGKEDPVNDWWVDIPGSQNTIVKKNKDLTVGNNHTEDIGNDQTVTIGNRQDVTVGLEASHRTALDNTISVGKSLRLVNDAGAGLTLHESGALILNDAFGNEIALGGISAGLNDYTSDAIWYSRTGSLNWHLFDNNLNIYRINNWDFGVNASGNVRINGKNIATVGAPDSGGDVLTSKGWS